MTSNRAAMLKGFEEVWSKALTYIESEPYRSKVVAHLARSRFRIAVSDSELATSESLTKLTQARATDRKSIPMGAYICAYILIAVPGMRRFARLPWILSLRQLVHLTGFP